MKFILVIPLLFLTSCASLKKAAPPPIEKKITVQAPFDKAWAGVIKFFSERGIPVKTIEKESGLIATENMTINTDSDLFVCDGFGMNGKSARSFPGTANFNVFVTKIDEKTTSIQMNTFGRAVAYDPGAPPYVPPSTHDLTCYTNGKMEQNLFNEINARTPAQASK
ncbi:hypothetical protein ACES2I_12585 [Bdellovibrio bacteriovorus]|uniref:hypothetical protein n=1 Tax=Bdellovibrio bacteriovorus TaxID=959 RepID=UPI0035A60624